MKNLKQKKQSFFVKVILIPLLSFGVLITVMTAGIIKFDNIGKEQELLLAQSALKKAIIQCYAVEGMYPADVSYLEDHYYLTIDKKKYDIFYECFSSNIMPEYGVYEK